MPYGQTCVCGHQKRDHDGPGESCGKCDCLYYEHDESEMELQRCRHTDGPVGQEPGA